MSENLSDNQSESQDQDGLHTLQVMSSASAYNQWMYQTIAPFCQGKILEIGAGLGNISRYFLQDNCDLYVSDFQYHYREALIHLMRLYKMERDPFDIDLMHPYFEKVYGDLIGGFDTVFALNVIEHIEDDRLALNNAWKLLKRGGRLIVLVPSYNWLFNELDRALKHVRRYTKKDLEKLFQEFEWPIIHKQYFNCVGIPAWFLSGKLQRNSLIPSSQLRLFDTFVPLFKWIDRLTFNVAGLSTIIIGQK